MYIETHEQCHCLQCKSIIPREHISRRLLHAAALTCTRRIVKAWCEHCDRLYELTQVLRDGHWLDDGEVQLVTDAQRLKGFKSRIAHLRGEQQALSA